jgi:hypothetical protein
MPAKFLIHFLFFACLLAAGIFLSCEETLPPYQAPQNVLRAEVKILGNTVDRQVKCDDSFKGWSVPPMIFHLDVINNYTETLQGSADLISGQLEVWYKENPDFGKRFPVNGVLNSPHINNHILTLDPGDTLSIPILWYHDDEQGRRIWKAFNNRPLNARINARARIKVFPSAPILTPADVEIRVLYNVDTNISFCDQ